jgi:S1-C subfamily serine protease
MSQPGLQVFLASVRGRFPAGLALTLVLALAPGLSLSDGLSGQEPVAVNTDSQSTAPEPGGRAVLVRALLHIHDVLAPYSTPEIREVYGSGVWLGAGLVLTDLRLARYATVIEIWPPDKREPVAATVLHAGYDCGLAVIGSDSKADLPDTARELFSTRQPTIGQEVRILGFDSAPSGAVPQAGARAGIWQSFVRAGRIATSDIDRHALRRIEPVTRAPGPGYSGGPVLSDDHLVGLFFHARGADDAAGISGQPYVLDADVIQAFLADIKADGRYGGFVHTGLRFDSLRGAATRRYLGLTGTEQKAGVFIRRVDFRSPAWQKVLPGDILLAVDDRAVDPEGKIAGSDHSVQHVLASLPATRVKLKLLRQGQALETELDLTIPSARSPGPGRARTESQPRYFLGAGLVFQELDFDLIHYGSPALRADPYVLHRYFDYYADRLGEQIDRDVILSARLPDPINADSERFVNGIVRAVNGRRVRNLQDFAAEWSYARGDYVVVEFLNRESPLVLSHADLKQAEQRVRTKYGVQENGRVR